jgi:hypothetical protein
MALKFEKFKLKTSIFAVLDQIKNKPLRPVYKAKNARLSLNERKEFVPDYLKLSVQRIRSAQRGKPR